MASISTDNAGNVRIMFSADGRRKTIYLGGVTKKVAAAVKLRVEALVSAAAAGVAVDPQTAAWTASIPDDLAAKLAAVGLMAERPRAVTVAGLLAVYAAEKEAKNKTGTQTNHTTITNDLVGYFGADADPRRLTAADGERFLDHLKARGLAAYTVARRVGRCRSIFAYGMKKALVTANPFAEVSAPSTLPADRKVYVPAADVGRVMGYATPLWRTIIALSRFGGLRCPSETLKLKWADVDLAGGRMSIPNPKTEGSTGQAYRVAPIFAALRPYLEDAWELAPAGTVYVVSGEFADQQRERAEGPAEWVNINLRTQFLRIIKRAGLTPWPKLFHQLRASCETDLLAEFPITAVTEWLGHSPEVALRHYARVPDHLFVRAAAVAATGDAKSDAPTTQIPTQTGADGKRLERTRSSEVLAGQASGPILSAPVLSRPTDSVTLRRFELRSQP